jgi:hypothetical protein
MGLIYDVLRLSFDRYLHFGARFYAEPLAACIG